MPISVSGSQITFNDASTQTTAANGFGFKNRIINGAMMIDQRNAGASVTPTAGQYTLDRWSCNLSQSGKYTVQRNAGSVTPPVGFTNYIGITSTSAYSITSTDYFMFQQPIEGFNTADLAWGTANAQTVTLSFWVRSSLTGTFGGAIQGGQAYPFSYTISSANTWEQKTITIAGSTSGTWGTSNNVGLYVTFSLGMGSTYSGTAGVWSNSNFVSATGATSVVGTNGATFYITGVQLEKGSTATSFDYRPYGTELQLCQRYYNKLSADSGQVVGLNGFFDSTTQALFYYYYPVVMRSEPTLTTTGTSTDYYIRRTGGGTTNCSVVPAITGASTAIARIQGTVASGLTGGQGGALVMSTSPSYLGFNAEL